MGSTFISAVSTGGGDVAARGVVKDFVWTYRSGVDGAKRRFRLVMEAGAVYWRCRVSVNGRERQGTFETVDRTVAMRRCEQWWEGLRKVQEVEAGSGVSAGPTSLRAWVDWYAAMAVDAGCEHRVAVSTAKQNVACFWRVVDRGGLSGEGTVAELSFEVADRFYRGQVGAAVKEGVSGPGLEKVRRGAADTLRAARCLFAKWVVAAAGRVGVAGGDSAGVSGFLQGARRSKSAVSHREISAGVRREMFEVMEREVKEADPRLWLAHTLLAFSGLRAREAVAARKSWVVRYGEQWFLEVVQRDDFDPKGAWGAVPLHKSWWTEWARVRRALAEEAGEVFGPESPLIPGVNARKLVSRVHSAWLRTFLPAEEYLDTNHELRRWAGGVIRARWGVDAHGTFLRHAAKDVATANYTERLRVQDWATRGAVSGEAGVSVADALGMGAVGKLERAEGAW